MYRMFLARKTLEESLNLFYRAIDLDAGLAAAYGMAAWCYSHRKIQGWIVDKGWEEAETRRLAFRVSSIAQDDALALCHAGFALFYVCNDFETGAALIDKGLSINQNLAIGWRYRAASNLFIGEHEAVINFVNRSMRLSPLDPSNYAAESIAAASLMFLGKYDDAIKLAARSLAGHPTHMLTLRTLVVANALTGDLEKARHALAQVREVYPTLRLSELKHWLPFRRPRCRADG